MPVCHGSPEPRLAAYRKPGEDGIGVPVFQGNPAFMTVLGGQGREGQYPAHGLASVQCGLRSSQKHGAADIVHPRIV